MRLLVQAIHGGWAQEKLYEEKPVQWGGPRASQLAEQSLDRVMIRAVPSARWIYHLARVQGYLKCRQDLGRVWGGEMPRCRGPGTTD